MVLTGEPLLHCVSANILGGMHRSTFDDEYGFVKQPGLHQPSYVDRSRLYKISLIRRGGLLCGNSIESVPCRLATFSYFSRPRFGKETPKSSRNGRGNAEQQGELSAASDLDSKAPSRLTSLDVTGETAYGSQRAYIHCMKRPD